MLMLGGAVEEFVQTDRGSYILVWTVQLVNVLKKFMFKKFIC